MLTRATTMTLVLATTAVVGCIGDARDSGFTPMTSAGPSAMPPDSGSGTTSDSDGAATTTLSTSAGDAASTTDGGSGTATSGDGPNTGAGPKLDVGAEPTSGDAPQLGCDKVDFLFVIDASGSMDNEQAKLVDAFEGFIGSIVDEVGVEDFHILATDTDPWADEGFIDLCLPAPDCCLSGVCAESFQAVCNVGTNCWELLGGEDCDVEMGAGRRWSATGDDCGIVGGRRWMTQDQPNLSETFACAAAVGTRGSSSERAIEAMLAAVSGPMNAAGGCNESFLRDDAILVVTVITDEPNQTSGTAAAWVDALTAAKNGDPTAFTLIGLTPQDDVEFGALFGGQGMLWADVESADYESVFLSAIGDIDTTCETFDPPG